MKEWIRIANPADSADILKIYAPYVENTSVSFETEVPSVEAFAERIEKIGRQYPYLVYCVNEQIVGYAYASRHMERAAYAYNVEASIYVASIYHGKEVASRLYDCLFSILREQGIYNVYAAYTEPNEKSRRFHEKKGFSPVGTYHKTGYKFNQWYDVTWMETCLFDCDAPQIERRPVGELSVERVETILLQHSNRG